MVTHFTHYQCCWLPEPTIPPVTHSGGSLTAFSIKDHHGFRSVISSPFTGPHDSGPFPYVPFSSWWRHQMEAFSALLALCAENSPVTGEFPAQRPVMWSFDVFFDLHLNKRLSKQLRGWWFEIPLCSLWCHCNVMHIPSRVFAHEIHMNIMLIIQDYFNSSDKITTQTTMNYNFNLMSP